MSRNARLVLAVASAVALLTPAFALASGGGNKIDYTANIKLTADNAYEVIVGDAAGTLNVGSLGGPVNNTTNGQIHACDATGVEYYAGRTVLPADYVYIVAMNDGSVTQGLLGQLDTSGGPIVTNGAGWQVFDTGDVGNPNSFPTTGQITTYIQKANLGTGNVAGSKGWVDINGAVTPGSVGTLAVGQAGVDSSPDPLPPVSCTSGDHGITSQARWIWYRPQGVASSPFVASNTPGHSTNIMIFRLTPQNVPAMSPLGLVVMSLLLAGVSLWLLRRRTRLA